MKKFTYVILFIVFIFSSVVYSQGDFNFNGTYNYCEDAGRQQFWYYNLSIQDNAVGDLKIDGHMYMVRIKLSVKISNNKASFYFNEYGENNIPSTNFKQGDLLFELENKGKEIITDWKKLQPIIEGNDAQGKVRFKKEEGQD